MADKFLTTRFYYLDDDANSILCDAVYFDGTSILHKIIRPSRYSAEIKSDIEYGYNTEDGLMTTSSPQQFLENFKKKYYGTYFYASSAEMLNLSELA